MKNTYSTSEVGFMYISAKNFTLNNSEFRNCSFIPNEIENIYTEGGFI